MDGPDSGYGGQQNQVGPHLDQGELTLWPLLAYLEQILASLHYYIIQQG